MKRLLALLFLAFFVSADTLNVKNISATTIDVELIFEVENKGSSTLPYATFVTYPFYNLSGNQRVLEIGSNMQILNITREADGNQRIYLNFSIGPNEKKNISIYGKVLVNYNQKLNQSVPYPFNVPKDLENYTKESSYVLIDDDIKRLADELKGNSTDTLEIIGNVVNWVYHNINYNKSYIADTKTSTFVLKERQGVCDEYSHLTIALLRYLGIPSRIIVGYVHSGEFWGPHAWVEIWMPNIEWMEADSTFIEAGWLDGTHLRTSHGVDQKTVVDYFSTTADFDLRSLALGRYQTAIFNETGAYLPSINISLFVPENPLEQQQETNITAEITNPTEDYLFLPLRFKPSQEFTLLNDSIVLSYLKPNETKIVNWVVVLPNMSIRYTYKLPMVLEVGGYYIKESVTGKKVLEEEDYPRYVRIDGYGILPVGDAGKVSIVITGNKRGGVNGTIAVTIRDWTTGMNYSLNDNETKTLELPVPAYLLTQTTKGLLNISYEDYYVNLPLPIQVVGAEEITPIPTASGDVVMLQMQVLIPIFIGLIIVISGVVVFLAKQKRIS